MADDDPLGLIDAYEQQKEDRGKERFIRQRQATALTDDAFRGTDLRDEVSVGMEGTDPIVEKRGRLSDEQFDTFRNTVNDYTTFVRGPGPNVNQVNDNALESVPDPREVHQSRSQEAQRQDKRMSAPLTNDPERYANAPDEYDWPGVDSPPSSEASDASILDDFKSLF